MMTFLKALILPIITVCIFFLLLLLVRKSGPVLTTIRDLLPQRGTKHNLTPIHSNQWYSSLYRPLPSQPLYAFPLAFRLTPQGLGFSYPNVVFTQKAVHAPYDEDFTVGLDTSFTNQALESISDWSIQASLTDSENNSLHFTLGHGIPFTTVKASTRNITLSFPHPFSLYPNNDTAPFTGQSPSGQNLVITTKNHDYLLVFPLGTRSEVEGKQIRTDSDRVFIALLDSRNHYDNFLNISNIEVKSTSVSHSVNDNSLFTSYMVETNGQKPLLTVFPHQKEYLAPAQKILGSYNSLRGPLVLIEANSFSTQIPLRTPEPTFPLLSAIPKSLEDQIKSDSVRILSEQIPPSRNYYLGTYLGKVTSLIQLAEIAGLKDESRQLRAHLKPVLLDSLNYFVYNQEKTSFIATKSEFGNDVLNDHHFQYGYYIRTAAILAEEDNVYLEQIKPKIQEMVRDIATIDRSNRTYPFLRNFDMYEGHSWASGFSEYPDGNNQESSSEALNAWYSLFLWANVTRDQRLHDYALYLFNTELTSAKHYWFNAENIYTSPYAHQIGSIIWGGKVDFSTWFSAETNMIYGIQLLPFTPASFYLEDLSSFEKYEEDFLKSNGDFNASWGELFVMWKALAASRISESYLQRTGALQEDNFSSLYLYFLYHNLQTKK